MVALLCLLPGTEKGGLTLSRLLLPWPVTLAGLKELMSQKPLALWRTTTCRGTGLESAATSTSSRPHSKRPPAMGKELTLFSLSHVAHCLHSLGRGWGGVGFV